MLQKNIQNVAKNATKSRKFCNIISGLFNSLEKRMGKCISKKFLDSKQKRC